MAPKSPGLKPTPPEAGTPRTSRSQQYAEKITRGEIQRMWKLVKKRQEEQKACREEQKACREEQEAREEEQNTRQEEMNQQGRAHIKWRQGVEDVINERTEKQDAREQKMNERTEKQDAREQKMNKERAILNAEKKEHSVKLTELETLKKDQGDLAEERKAFNRARGDLAEEQREHKDKMVELTTLKKNQEAVKVDKRKTLVEAARIKTYKCNALGIGRKLLARMEQAILRDKSADLPTIVKEGNMELKELQVKTFG